MTDGPTNDRDATAGSRAPNFPAPGAPDIEIARAVEPREILTLAAERMGMPPDALAPYGHHKAKITATYLDALRVKPPGKLVLVTAITPTPAGEGKTTTTIGLNDGLNALGVKSAACLREPSLGPCFGVKGGAAGGGRAQAIPMEDINLHFNGDFHAITSAHSLLSAMIDNHLHWDNKQDLDPRRVSWRRVVDMNDRALRRITIGLGGPTQGVPREDGFDITVASEIMAILCLAEDLADLQARLGRIVVGRRRDKTAVTAADIGADGAMAVLLKDALQPNLVQSLDANPVFIHGGPFANIAHGCNSVIATRAALAMNDVVVTEAGFGADLGAEKFFDIKVRQSGITPHAVVLVATIRALKMHGGVAKEALGEPAPEAVAAGASNLVRHIENLQGFGIAPVVAVNRFSTDTREEFAAIEAACAPFGVDVVEARHWAEGAGGAHDLARAVMRRLDAPAPDVQLTYDDDQPLTEKIRAVAQRIYRADDIDLSAPAAKQLGDIERLGFAHFPVCIAKTQYSFSTDPAAKGAPSGHRLPVREARLAAGAGFVVVICGDVMTMPGLPRRPAALDIGLDEAGRITGLS
ncbi:MAG: formate--tetrahydrofolate ligase [Pseudomonadota bacterium]